MPGTLHMMCIKKKASSLPLFSTGEPMWDVIAYDCICVLPYQQNFLLFFKILCPAAGQEMPHPLQERSALHLKERNVYRYII